MATYLILNLLVLITIIIIAAVLRYRWTTRQHAIALIVLLVLTLIFDNLIILADIVAYDPVRILGFHIVKAPVEDFFYALAAGIFVPLVWRITKGKS